MRTDERSRIDHNFFWFSRSFLYNNLIKNAPNKITIHSRRKTCLRAKFPFNTSELNEIINRRKDDYDEETKYLINCLWYKASQWNREREELIQWELRIIKLCQERIKEKIIEKNTTIKDLKNIKESADEILKSLWYNIDERNVNKKIRFDILVRDNFTCNYCWRSAPDVILHIDHMLPFSKWWKTTTDNLITSCSDCNLWKKIDMTHEKNDKNSVWRPSVITEDTLAKLEFAFANSFTDEEASLYANIHISTLYRYCEDNIEFRDRKEALKKQPNIKAKLNWIKKMEEWEYQASKEWLERKSRDEFSLKQEINSKVEHTIIDNIDIV